MIFEVNITFISFYGIIFCITTLHFSQRNLKFLRSFQFLKLKDHGFIDEKKKIRNMKTLALREHTENKAKLIIVQQANGLTRNGLHL